MAYDLYLQAKTWGTRPSQLLGILNDYEAFCLDQAIHFFGSQVDAELSKVQPKAGESQASTRAKTMGVLRRMLDPEGKTKDVPGQYADPGAKF
jgi:hypothetical protein